MSSPSGLKVEVSHGKKNQIKTPVGNYIAKCPTGEPAGGGEAGWAARVSAPARRPPAAPLRHHTAPVAVGGAGGRVLPAGQPPLQLPPQPQGAGVRAGGRAGQSSFEM